jgi:hypothetical protein
MGVAALVCTELRQNSRQTITKKCGPHQRSAARRQEADRGAEKRRPTTFRVYVESVCIKVKTGTSQNSFSVEVEISITKTHMAMCISVLATNFVPKHGRCGEVVRHVTSSPSVGSVTKCLPINLLSAMLFELPEIWIITHELAQFRMVR